MLAAMLGICLLIALIAMPAGGALSRARAALGAGDPGEALAALDEALRADPEGVEALMLLGQVTLSLGRYDDAAAAFRRAAALAGPSNPNGIEALCGLADAQARSEQNVEALATLNRVLAAAPSRPAVHHDMGKIHFALGRLEAAASAFREEITLAGGQASATSPIVGSAWEGLGITAYRLGDDDTALAALEKSPPSLEADWHHGLVLARKGRHDDALLLLNKVVAREPSHAGAWQGIARSAAALGREALRREALEKVAASYRKDEEARALKRRLFELRAQTEHKALSGDPAGAALVMEEAAALAPDDLTILFDVGRLKEMAKDLPGAEAAFRRLLARDPLHAQAYFRIGRMLADRGDMPGAIDALGRAAGLSPMTPSFHVHLARAHLRSGRADAGVRELRLARRLTPEDPESAFNLALGLASAGQMTEAAAELEAAAGLGFAEPQIFAAMARVYGALGDQEKSSAAQAEFERRSRNP